MQPLRPADPAEIGGYPLLGRLGEGGMGLVYLALAGGGRHVALKVVREGLDDPQVLARFRREARTVARVRSRYAAALVASGLTEEPFWLATEYVPGPTLRQAVQRYGPPPAATCVRLLAALATGLAEVHAQGVEHRDVKPSNVVLAPDNPRLIDFGIARGEDQTQITRTGGWNGTPGHVAPEVLREQVFGPPADVFSLGVTVAYAATGRPPFGTGPVEAVLLRTINDEPDLAGLPAEMAAPLAAAMSKDPADRPTPRELAAACGPRARTSGAGTGARPVALAGLENGFASDSAYQHLTALAAQPAPADVATAVRQGLVPDGHGRPDSPRRAGVIAGAAAAAVLVLGSAVAFRYFGGGDGDNGDRPPAGRPAAAGPTVTAASRPSFEGSVADLSEGRSGFGSFLKNNVGRKVRLNVGLDMDLEITDGKGTPIDTSGAEHDNVIFQVWSACENGLPEDEKPEIGRCTAYHVNIGNDERPWKGLNWVHGKFTFQGNFEVSGGDDFQGVTLYSLLPVAAD
ncbi:protein kinase [Actinomadura sp. DSM 109109]|nr:protein kinase [Actinomadura lepetitiana]